jgi:hypothetical protein
VARVAPSWESVVRYVVWNGGKWYFKQWLRAKRASLRARLPRRRTSLAVALAGASLVTVGVALARRSGA